MVAIHVQLDDQILERARRLAESRHCTLEDLVKEMIEQLGAGDEDRVLGVLRDGAELLDQVVESAMSEREQHVLRLTAG